MCTQSVGLVAGVLEAAGIATTCVALVRSVAERVRPPRALAVPFPFGAPLGRAHDAPAQRRGGRRPRSACSAAPGPGPVLVDL
jgi:hypothetical protein